MPKGKRLSEDEQIAELRRQAAALEQKINEKQGAKAEKLARDTEAGNLQLGHICRSLLAADPAFRRKLIAEANRLSGSGQLFAKTKRKETQDKARLSIESVLGKLDPFIPSETPSAVLAEDLGEFIPTRPTRTYGDDEAAAE